MNYQTWLKTTESYQRIVRAIPKYLRAVNNTPYVEKQYKKLYMDVSTFINANDVLNQVHLHERILCYDVLLFVLLKILRKAALSTVKQRNKVDIAEHTQTINSYLTVLKELVLYYYVNLSQVTGNHDRITQLYEQKQSVVRQIHITTEFKVSEYLGRFFYMLQKVFRWQSYFDENHSYRWAAAAQAITSIGPLKHKWISNGLKNNINVLNKFFEMGDLKQCQAQIDLVNNSKILFIIRNLLRQFEQQSPSKQKVKTRNQFQQLLKGYIWFQMQTIFVYAIQTKRCLDIITNCYWFVQTYCKPKDELLNHVKQINKIIEERHSQTISLELLIDKFFMTERIKTKIKESQTQFHDSEERKESNLYYYGKQFSQPSVYKIRSETQMNTLVKSRKLSGIDLPKDNFNLSQVDTRQSSAVLYKRSISVFSTNTKESQPHPLTQRESTERQNEPLLDKVIRSIIEKKISIPAMKKWGGQQEKLINKDNTFYKQQLMFKNKTTLIQKNKTKFNQEIITSISNRADEQQLLDKLKVKEIQILHEPKPDDNQSLLSFELPNKKLTPMQRLRKIIFAHPEVFYLVQLRMKLKNRKRSLIRRTSSVVSTTTPGRRSTSKSQSQNQEKQSGLSHYDEELKIRNLRKKSQEQLQMNILSTEEQLREIKTELKHLKPDIPEQRIRLNRIYGNICDSILKQ